MAYWLWMAPFFAFADPQVVRLYGTALLPNGEPAVGATVIGACWHSPTVRAQTDRSGAFSLASEFAGPANITAITTDGRFAGKLWIAPQNIRRRADEALSLKLTPTRQVHILVRKDGKPAANVQVGYSKESSPQRTDERGSASFSILASETNVSFSAWDPIRGVGGASLNEKSNAPTPDSLEIELQPITSHKFKVVNEFNRPVAGLKLVAQCRVGKDGWFLSEYFPDSFGETDVNGEWTVPWLPPNGRSAHVESKGLNWIDEGIGERGDDFLPVTLFVRKGNRLKGRVAMPDGVSPENLLVEASSFGVRSGGASAGARVRADGTFELPVVSDHFYTVGIVDEEWTSPRHYGVLFATNETPKELTLKGEKATTVEVRVVAGKDKKPVVGVFVQGGEQPSKEWRDPSGKKQSCVAGLRQYGYSDEHGIARFGLNREPVSFLAFQGQWQQTVEAAPPKSGTFRVDFHKPFVDVLRVAGKIVPPPAAPGRVVLKAAPVGPGDHPSIAVPLAADGSFRFESMHSKLNLFAADAVGKTSSVAAVDMETDSLVLSMIPTGAYGGTAKNPDGDAIPGCEVKLFLDRASTLFSMTTKADANGKFLFEGVPAETKLCVKLSPPGLQTRFPEHGEAYVERGERYLDAVDVCTELPATKPNRERPIAKALAINAIDARLWHAPALVIACGSGTEATEFAKPLSTDEDYTEAEYLYCFPLKVTAERLAGDADGKAEFAKRGWPIPGAGEVVLAAFSSEGTTIGKITLNASDPNAVKRATTFLLAHAPKKTPAMAAVEAALAEAKATKRNVFFQTGGLRCGPCYLFARWIDQHRSELDKHFVFVKLSNLHSGWETVVDRLQLKPSGGIPWTAVLDADGKVLVTSDGPVGNIGFPSGGLGKKHFRKMLEAGAKQMTTAEREALLATLPKS